MIQTLLLLALFLASSVTAFAQSPRLDCRIDQLSPRKRTLNIACNALGFSTGKVTLRFTDAFAGVERLTERIYTLRFRDTAGRQLQPEIHGEGIYEVEGTERLTVNYEMQLARAFEPAQHALVSSLGPESAVLMLTDLLPQVCVNGAQCAGAGRVQINAPAGWKTATTERLQDNAYEISAASGAVFFLGALRERRLQIGEMALDVAIAGNWSFRDDDVFAYVEAIAREQAAMIAGGESGNRLVTLAPFPQPMTGLRSSAVTLGHTVVLMFNGGADATASLALYRKHLAHELFHFYLPNAFQIRENFDWFWEGFTRYVSLVTLARLHWVTQREYLDAISDEHEAYAYNPLRAQVSLIEASREKFSGAAYSDLVYRKGALAAALYDLELRWQSRGGRNVLDVMRALYRDYALRSRAIGNREVLDALRQAGNFGDLIHNDIETAREIEIENRIKPYGLVMELSRATRGRALIVPIKKPTERQQALLYGLAK